MLRAYIRKVLWLATSACNTSVRRLHKSNSHLMKHSQVECWLVVVFLPRIALRRRAEGYYKQQSCLELTEQT